MGDASHLKFLVAYMVFFLFISQMVVWGATDIFTQEFVEITPPSCEIDGWDAVVDAVGCVFDNMGIFFSLMTISSEYTLLGTLLLTPLILGLVFVILSLIRGN